MLLTQAPRIIPIIELYYSIHHNIVWIEIREKQIERFTEKKWVNVSIALQRL